MSASAYASFEPAAPHVGVHAPAHVAEVRAAIRAGKFTVTMRDVWSRLPMALRIVVVMLACDQTGKPDVIARQPWDSFSARDQLAMASSARMVRAELAEFAAVA